MGDRERPSAAGAARARRALRAADRLERAAAADPARPGPRGARARGQVQLRRPFAGRLARALSPRGPVRRLRRPLQAARAAARRPLVYVGDGYSDRCAALAADRVFARSGLADYLTSRNEPFEPFRPSTTLLLHLPEPYDFALSTERFRAFGVDLANLGTRAACTASSARASCGSRRRPEASTSSRSTPRPPRWSRSCSGSSSGSPRSTVWAAAARLSELVPLGFPSATAPDPFESLVTSITAQQVSLFAGVRDPLAADRALRREAASASASRRANGSRPRGEDDLVALGFSRRKAEYVIGLARAESTWTASGARRRRDACRLTALRGLGPWTAEWFLARHLARPRAWPAGDLACARRPINLLRSRCARARSPPRSVPEPLGPLPPDGLGWRAAVNVRRATRRTRPCCASSGRSSARGPRAAGRRARDVGRGVGRRAPRHRGRRVFLAEDDAGAVGVPCRRLRDAGQLAHPPRLRSPARRPPRRREGARAGVRRRTCGRRARCASSSTCSPRTSARAPSGSAWGSRRSSW